MKSLRKAASNQRNAKRSTGPSTSIGKSRSALNAATHGLSSKVAPDAETLKHQNYLATLLAGGHASNPVIMVHAEAAAEALIALKKVKLARGMALKNAASHYRITLHGKYNHFLNLTDDPELLPHQLSFIKYFKRYFPFQLEPPFADDLEREAAILKVASKPLTKLLRYELRAINQRDRCLTALDQAMGRAEGNHK